MGGVRLCRWWYVFGDEEMGKGENVGLVVRWLGNGFGKIFV